MAKVNEELKHSSNYFRTQRTVHGGTNHRSCFSAFQNKRSRHISNIVCPKSNRIFSNPLEISETFAEYQKSKVQFYDPSADMQKADINMIANSPLRSVLNNHNVTLADFLPSFDSPPPTNVSSCEIQSAISSFKSNSALGPSGQPKKFFEFLFRLNWTFFTNAINRLMKIQDFQNSNFAWIKNRPIIFIKKAKK